MRNLITFVEYPLRATFAFAAVEIAFEDFRFLVQEIEQFVGKEKKNGQYMRTGPSYCEEGIV